MAAEAKSFFPKYFGWEVTKEGMTEIPKNAEWKILSKSEIFTSESKCELDILLTIEMASELGIPQLNGTFPRIINDCELMLIDEKNEISRVVGKTTYYCTLCKENFPFEPHLKISNCKFVESIKEGFCCKVWMVGKKIYVLLGKQKKLNVEGNSSAFIPRFDKLVWEHHNPKFEQVVWRHYNCCAVSSTKVKQILEPTYIVPIGECGNSTIANGLLLRKDLHILFVEHLLTFKRHNGDYSVKVGKMLMKDPFYCRFDGAIVKLEFVGIEEMKEHARFFKYKESFDEKLEKGNNWTFC